MFQMIVAAISILIVIALSIAAMYFMGDSYSESAVKALYATDMQQGEQIQAGYKLQESTTGVVPSGTTQQQFQELTDAEYLRDVPNGWLVDNFVLYKPLTNTQQCVAMNKVSKKFDPSVTYDGQTPNGCPACEDTRYSDWVGCQSDAVSGQ